jgi:hypothetical protein
LVKEGGVNLGGERREVLETEGENLALEALRIAEAEAEAELELVIYMMISHKKVQEIRFRLQRERKLATNILIDDDDDLGEACGEQQGDLRLRAALFYNVKILVQNSAREERRLAWRVDYYNSILAVYLNENL